MNLCTRNLIPVTTTGVISPPFTVSPGGAPVLVSLIDAGTDAPHPGAIPASAFARIQKLNSLGNFNDLTFIGSGRDLAALLNHPGEYRVVTPTVPDGLAFGIDITCADFAIASPGTPEPGDSRTAA